MTEMCSYDYISDEEVSTCKERHARLGEDNLNDTLEYDFGGQSCMEEKPEELKAKENDLMANQNACHVTETKVEDVMLLNGSLSLAPNPVIQPCVHNCSHSSPLCDLNKDVDNIPAKNDGMADLKDQQFKPTICHCKTLGNSVFFICLCLLVFLIFCIFTPF